MNMYISLSKNAKNTPATCEAWKRTPWGGDELGE